MSEREITLSVDLPEVVEVPVRTEVRCGENSVDIHEYVCRGSGQWAVWIGDGHVVGKHDLSRDEAITAARSYVQQKERSRLLHQQLRARLEASDGE